MRVWLISDLFNIVRYCSLVRRVGKADMDITGWVWYMHKTYVSREVALQQLADSGRRLEGDLILQQEQQQMQQQLGAERDQHGEVIPEWVRESERELLQQPPPPLTGGAGAAAAAPAPGRLPPQVGSAMGSRKHVREMLAFCARHNISVQVDSIIPFSEVNEGLAKVRAGKARYRVLLKQPDEGKE